MWGPYESSFFSRSTQPMHPFQNHHSNSNNMYSPYSQGVLKREGIPGGIFLAAQWHKLHGNVIQGSHGQPLAEPKLWLESHPACKWLLVFQKNCRLSVVNLSFQAFPSCFSQLSSTNPTNNSHGVLGCTSTSEVVTTGIPAPMLPGITHTT